MRLPVLRLAAALLLVPTLALNMAPRAALAQTAPGSPFWMSGAPASDAGNIACNQMPALTGDVTTVSGTCATTLAAIQTKTVSGTTGTTNVVFSASPTLTGTLTVPAVTTASGALLLSSSAGPVQIGSGAAVGSSGNLGFPKITASGNAPGAGTAKLEVVAGTIGGTCKLQAYAGTSATPTVIADNIGSGC